VALAIMDTFEGKDLVGIVARGDAHSLQRVPGLGTKSSQRLVLELKGKLDGLFEAVPAADQGAASLNGAAAAADEASQALLALGYSHQEVEKVMKRLIDGQPAVTAVSELVRSALKELGKGKDR
jgi:Holliday junction DNA helicase RuvA